MTVEASAQHSSKVRKLLTGWEVGKMSDKEQAIKSLIAALPLEENGRYSWTTGMPTCVR